MATSCYSTDTSPMDASKENNGFLFRRGFFREAGATEQDDRVYTKDAVTFIGLLHTDFSYCVKPLIPQARIEVNLFLAPDECKLMCAPGEDDKKYQLKLLSCHMFCAVAGK